jgi:hypothetical protein
MSEKAPQTTPEEKFANVKQHPLKKSQKEKPDITDRPTEKIPDEFIRQHLRNPFNVKQLGEDTIKAVGNKIAEATKTVGTKVAETARHSVLGDAWAAMQRTGIRLLHNHHIADTERLYQKAHLKSIKLGVNHSNSEQVVNGLTERLAEFDKRVAKLKSGKIRNAKAEISAEKERAGILQQLEQAKIKLDRAKKPLDAINNTKAQWENAQKKFVEGALNHAKEKMSPFTERFGALQSRRKELTADIANFNTIKEKGAAEIESLKERLDSKDTFKFEKPEIKKQIADIKHRLKVMDKKYQDALRENSKLETKMSAVSKRLGKWHNLEDEYAHITRRERAYEHPDKERVAPNLNRKGHSFDEFAQKPTAPEKAKGSEGEKEGPEKSEAQEELAQITPGGYIAGWNWLFKNELPIIPEDFLKENKKMNRRKVMPAAEIEKVLKTYIQKTMRVDKTGKVRYLSDKAIEDRFAQIREKFLTKKSHNYD